MKKKQIQLCVLYLEAVWKMVHMWAPPQTEKTEPAITTRWSFICQRMWRRTDRRTKGRKLKRKLGEQRRKSRKKDRKGTTATKRVNRHQWLVQDRVADLGDCVCLCIRLRTKHQHSCSIRNIQCCHKDARTHTFTITFYHCCKLPVLFMLSAFFFLPFSFSI